MIQSLIGIVQLLSLLAPIVKDAVALAEDTIGPGKGTEKLAHAVESIEGALPKVASLAKNAEAVRAAVVPMIEATIAAAKAADVPLESAPATKPKPKPKKKRAPRRRA